MSFNLNTFEAALREIELTRDEHNQISKMSDSIIEQHLHAIIVNVYDNVLRVLRELPPTAHKHEVESLSPITRALQQHDEEQRQSFELNAKHSLSPDSAAPSHK